MNATTIPQQDIDWSRNMFSMIKLNGAWGVPSSGLIFRKLDHETFALDEVMPWMSEMGAALEQGLDVPTTPERLREFQLYDYKSIARRFEAAGIKMPDPKGLLTEVSK